MNRVFYFIIIISTRHIDKTKVINCSQWFYFKIDLPVTVIFGYSPGKKDNNKLHCVTEAVKMRNKNFGIHCRNKETYYYIILRKFQNVLRVTTLLRAMALDCYQVAYSNITASTLLDRL